MELTQLPLHQEGIIVRMSVPGATGQRLLDLGLTPHTPIRCIGRSPSGDPRAYLVRGAIIAIRTCDSDLIYMKLQSQTEVSPWNTPLH